MDQLTFPVLLACLALGGLLVALEVFLTPGVGIKAFMGVALIVFAVAFAYHRHGALEGTIMLGIAAVLLGALAWIAKRTIGRRLVLADSLASPPAADADIAGLAGLEGEALSQLRPSGVARIAGHRVDVSCVGEFVEKGTRVRVVSVEGNRVTVERA